MAQAENPQNLPTGENENNPGAFIGVIIVVLLLVLMFIYVLPSLTGQRSNTLENVPVNDFGGTNTTTGTSTIISTTTDIIKSTATASTTATSSNF